jgi:hypothetical protein
MITTKGNGYGIVDKLLNDGYMDVMWYCKDGESSKTSFLVNEQYFELMEDSLKDTIVLNGVTYKRVDYVKEEEEKGLLDGLKSWKEVGAKLAELGEKTTFDGGWKVINGSIYYHLCFDNSRIGAVEMKRLFSEKLYDSMVKKSREVK